MFPKVSVLMAVYNAEEYIAEAVKSILDQTFTDFELIVIDDGSCDRSPEILKFYLQQDQRIRFYHRENKGVSKTRNEMLSLARGELIAVMDADDVSTSNRLALQVDFLQKNQTYVCVGGAFNLIDEKGRFLTCLYPPEDNETIQQLMLSGHTAINHPCALIREQSIKIVGGYNEGLNTVGDLDFFLRLGEVGTLANLPDPVLNYRLTTNSISENKQLGQLEDMRFACEQAWQRRGIQGKFEVTKHWRSGRDRASRYQFALKYGWWAWNSGERKTALIYAVKALQIKPWGKLGWNLALCACLKSPPS